MPDDIVKKYQDLAGVKNISVTLSSGHIVSFTDAALRAAWETAGINPRGKYGDMPEHSLKKDFGTRIPVISLL